jgi:ElaB/YqjD/DUF883 family membrane-anchored ribosome-binding protein
MANVHETNPAGRQSGSTVTPPTQSKDNEALHDKTRDTAAQMRERVSQTRDQVSEHAREVGAQAKELGDVAIDTASEYYKQGREMMREWESTLETKLREKPVQSLLIAGGIGLLLGLIWRRS